MDEVTVDRATLKALGADSRIEILKALGERRKTQAELSVEMHLSEPAISEHLARLNSAELVQRAPVLGASHKWKYYELTMKGKAIVIPSAAKVWFVLVLSILALSASVNQVYFGLTQPIGTYGSAMGANAADVVYSERTTGPSPTGFDATALAAIAPASADSMGASATPDGSGASGSEPILMKASASDASAASPQPVAASEATAPVAPLAAVDAPAVGVMLLSLVAFGWCLGVLIDRRRV